MERDGWQCRVCGDKEKQLTVHHLFYDSDFALWEYDPESMVTLCNDCHREIHKDLNKLAGLIAFGIMTGEFDAMKAIQ